MDIAIFILFVATAQQGTLGRAALHLGITQPALSNILNELESPTGEQLMLHSRQRSELTASGTRFLQDAIRILDALSLANRAMTPGGASVLTPLYIGDLPYRHR